MMNDYIDYYSYMNNLNQMGNQMYNEISMPATKPVEFADSYQGFIKGNMFDSLYKGYQNYAPAELNPANDRDYKLLLVQMYGFAAHDLSLYLDVNPNDVNVIKQRSEYMRLYKEALKDYEKSYGPITKTSDELYNSWSWNSNKWPWEGDK